MPGLDFLSINHALDIWPVLNLKIVRHGDLSFLNSEHVLEYLEKEFQRHTTTFTKKSGKARAAVFMQMPYAVAIIIQLGCPAVLDSHSHRNGRLGSLTCISGKSASAKDMAMYITAFMDRHSPSCCSSASHMCFLEIRDHL